MTLTITAILADGELDCFVEGGPQQNGRHIQDLKDMGFIVKTIKFPSWDEAYDWEDRYLERS